MKVKVVADRVVDEEENHVGTVLKKRWVAEEGQNWPFQMR